MLVIGVGTGCRELEGYLKDTKLYRATATLGAETDTLDAEGNVTETAAWGHVTAEGLDAALAAFRGDILQVPSMFSALKQGGERLYELARSGKTVTREPRQCRIDRLELTDVALPRFGLLVECSGGTYVRTLIADIARHADSLGHMVQLERTRQGPFTPDHCLSEDKWGDVDNIFRHLSFCADILHDYVPDGAAAD